VSCLRETLMSPYPDYQAEPSPLQQGQMSIFYHSSSVIQQSFITVELGLDLDM